ncbi:uncharacterized protein LOC117644774 [Thrips palmi]|uniref:ATP-dependent DNA helicase n=1 Tax=Thrips palmi TaxID=161013 RepID=A0A6P8Z135_THRPL|nr:uncharacterized protein LOC117644774 [Thrips palmi]
MMGTRKQGKIGRHMKCCVNGCDNFKGLDGEEGPVRLHKFPSHIEQCSKWIIFSGNAELTHDTVKQYRMCSDHFNDSEYSNVVKRIRLKKGAVPTKKKVNRDGGSKDEGEEETKNEGVNEEIDDNNHNIVLEEGIILNVEETENSEIDEVYSTKKNGTVTSEKDTCSENCKREHSETNQVFMESVREDEHVLHISGICCVDMNGGENTWKYIESEKENATSVVVIPSFEETDEDNSDIEVYKVSYGCEDKSIPLNDAIQIAMHGDPENDLEETDNERMYDDDMDIIPMIYEVIKEKRAWQTCCVPKCNNTNVNKSMFHFPKPVKQVERQEVINEDNLKRYIEWVSIINNLRIAEVDPLSGYKRYFVCSDHFEDHHFKDFTAKRKRLKGNAVPSKISTEPLPQQIMEDFKSMTQTWKDNIQQPMLIISDDICAESFLEDKLIWYTCDHCKEKRLVGSKAPKKCCHGKKCSDYTESNNMDPGEVPDELKDLTFIEEQLIARIHPIISYFKLKGLQYGYRGNVINFPQHVNDFARKLPHKIEDLAAVVNVRRKTKDDGYHDFRVRSMRIRKALEWLKIHNPYYKDVDINEEYLNNLPVDGNILSELNVEDNEDDESESNDVIDTDTETGDRIYHTGISNTQFPQQDEQIKEYLDWPKLGNEPIDEFNTPGYIACAFPSLFPYGNADLRQTRKNEIKTSNYFKHLIYYHDERFAKHTTFRFFAYNSWMRWTALKDGNVFVEKHTEYQNMTAERLKQLIAQNPTIMKKIMFHASNLRGTKAFWHARANELRDMVEQLGLPTIFLTLSCADGHWSDLFKLLTGNDDISTLTESDRRKLIQDNPKVVDEFFDHKVQSFIKHVMKKKYKVKDYWYRVEYQHRGSPHIHGLFWFEDAPDVSDLDNASEQTLDNILDYFSKLVSAIDPCPNTNDSDVHPCRITYNAITNFQEDLAQLLHKVQRHTKCGPDAPCWRKGKCRFNFPKPLQTDASIQKKEGTDEWEFSPACNDSKLNKYNQFIIQLWRANIDIAPVISKQALIAYLTKYISKCEVPSKFLETTFSDVIKTLEEDDKAKKVMQKVFLRSCAERDISAQEVMHTLLGLKLYNAGGRKFVIVNFKNEEWIPVIDTDDDDIRNKGTNIIEKYQSRPDTYAHATLYESARFYNLPKWSKPDKENIVRVFPRYTINDKEKFFRQQVLLHIPWRSEKDLLADYETWEEIYKEKGVDKLSHSAECEIGEIHFVPDESEEADEEYGSDVDDIEDEEGMILSHLGPHSTIPEVELGRREEDIHHNWHSVDDEYKKYGTIKQFETFIERMKIADKSAVSDTPTTQPPPVTLSKEQAEVIDFVSEQIKHMHSGKDDFIKSTIVQGKAGTGKSLLIRHVISLLENEFGNDSYLLGAPTGAAAVLINGRTINSIFHLPKFLENFKPLTGALGKAFADKFKNIKYIILDEFSMIGCAKLAMIDLRCKEATGHFDIPFGGICIMLLGDIKQLPPVRDTAIYATQADTNMAKHGMAIFKKAFQKTFILKKCFRQENDTFLQMLDKLSTGHFDDDSYTLLSQRFSSSVSPEEKDSFEDAMRLFAKKATVKAYNKKKLSTIRDNHGAYVPVLKIPAKHNNKHAALGKSSDADGLEKEIYLAKGCKVMLRHNLWVEKGLVNGTIGYVHDILFDENTNASNGMPAVIMCTFPSYTGPSLIPGENVVPIRTMSASWTDDQNTKCTRQQFPLVVAYACTIHKSQGMTLDKVVIDIEDREFSGGLSYVAFSRVRRLNNLLIYPFLMKRLSNLRDPKRIAAQVRFAFIETFCNKVNS